MAGENRMTEVFNAHATFWLRPDRAYRVYAADHELILIRIAGQPLDWVAALTQLGALGIWLGRKLNARRDASLRAKAEEADRVPPQVRVDQHPHSFRVLPAEVMASSFGPPATIRLHGPHAAVWRLALRNGSKWRFQLNDAEAVAALPVLRDVLGDRLSVEAVWDEARQAFVKRGSGREAMAR